jgi:hypothetical protein
MIYNECVERFGSSTEVSILVNEDGVELTTVNNAYSIQPETIPHRKITGEKYTVIK